MDIQPQPGESVADWRARLGTVSVESAVEVVHEPREFTLPDGQVVRFSPKTDAKPWTVTSIGPRGSFAYMRKFFADAADDWRAWTGSDL